MPSVRCLKAPPDLPDYSLPRLGYTIYLAMEWGALTCWLTWAPVYFTARFT